MAFPPELALATRNPGKIEEILAICSDWPVTWRLDEGPDPIDETGSTYRENALIKAGTVASAIRVPGVADDSGIEVDALGGAPGPRSARFAGPTASDPENLRLLIERLRAIPEWARTARYRCVAACVWPGGEDLWAEGTCDGTLGLEPRGDRGFGYDPIFVPIGMDRTMAELDPAEKNAISHRGKAFRSLGRLISQRP